MPHASIEFANFRNFSIHLAVKIDIHKHSPVRRSYDAAAANWLAIQFLAVDWPLSSANENAISWLAFISGFYSISLMCPASAQKVNNSRTECALITPTNAVASSKINLIIATVFPSHGITLWLSVVSAMDRKWMVPAVFGGRQHHS